MRPNRLFAVALVFLMAFTGCTTLTKQPAPPSVERQLAARAPGTTLRVVSINILQAGNTAYPWDKRRDSVLAALRDMNPDVFGVQEALWGQLQDLLGGLPGYACAGRGRDDGHTGGEFMGLYFRPDRFILKKAEVFWLSETPDVAGSKSWQSACVRCATVAIFIDRKDGSTLGVCDTHLDHISAEARDKGAQVIRRRLPTYGDNVAWVVTGDFNTSPDSPPYRALVSPDINPLRLTDTFRAVHPDAPAGTTTFHAYKEPWGKTRIDFIFCSPEFKPLAAGINQFKYRGTFPTDHFPVWADLQRVK